MTSIINTFSSYYRKKYGQPVGKLPVDTGYPCPNREKGGCIFCNADSFTPTHLNKNDSLQTQISRGKKNILKDRFKLYFGYFQQETCTAAPLELLLNQTERLLSMPQCVGVIFSTRPDYIDEDLLTALAKLVKQSGKECHFELGLQSAHQESLVWLNRNHTVKDFESAIHRIQEYDVFITGAHLIFGIPGESTEQMFESCRYVTSLDIDTIKLHHLQIVKETRLEKLHRSKQYTLFTKKAYIDFLLKLLPQIPPQVIIHRLWAHSHPEILVAPKWNILPGLLSAELYEKMKKAHIYQGCSYENKTSCSTF